MSSSKLSIQTASTGVCTELYVWGSDSHGQLGLGSKQRLAQQQKLKYQQAEEKQQQYQQYSIPKVCAYRLPIVRVAAGFRHALLITQKGRIYSVGSNAYGALGIGEDNNNRMLWKQENNKKNANVNSYSSPILIDSLKNVAISNAACGEDFSIAITHNGEVFAWGTNEYGEAGIIPTDKLGAAKRQYCTPQKLPHLENIRIVSVSCGRNHSLLLSSSGRVFASGDNRHGQIGVLSNDQDCLKTNEDSQVDYFQQGHMELGYVSDIVEVVCGHFHSLLMSVDGQILTSGLNSHGQLGNGNKLSQKIFKKIQCSVKLSKLAGGMYSSGGLSQMGEMYLWGSGAFGEYLIPTQFSKINSPVMQISLGTAAGSCVDSKGVVWCWGDNAYGELGVGDCGVRAKLFPVAALKEKRVVGVSCGNAYAIAWGEVFVKKISKRKKEEEEETKEDLKNKCQRVLTEGCREERRNIGRKRVISQYDGDEEDDYLREQNRQTTNTHGYSELTTDFSDKKKIQQVYEQQPLRQHSASSFQVDRQNRRITATPSYEGCDYQDIRCSNARGYSESGQRRKEPFISSPGFYQKDNYTMSSIQAKGIAEEYLQQDKNRRIVTSPGRRNSNSKEDNFLRRGKRIETEVNMKEGRNKDSERDYENDYDNIKNRRQLAQNGSIKDINELWKRMEQDDGDGNNSGLKLEYQEQYQKSNDLLMLLQQQQMKNHKRLSSYHHHRADKSRIIKNEGHMKNEKHNQDNTNSVSVMQNKENVNVNQHKYDSKIFSKENILKETKKIYESNNKYDNNTCTLSNSTGRNKKSINNAHSLDASDTQQESSSQRSQQVNQSDSNAMKARIQELLCQVDTLTAERDQAVLAKDQAMLERDTANDERDRANQKSLCQLNELNALKCQIIVEKSMSSGQFNSNSKQASYAQTPSCNRQKNSSLGRVNSHNQSQSQQGDIDQGYEKQWAQGNGYGQQHQQQDVNQESQYQMEVMKNKVFDEEKHQEIIEQQQQQNQVNGDQYYHYSNSNNLPEIQDSNGQSYHSDGRRNYGEYLQQQPKEEQQSSQLQQYQYHQEQSTPPNFKNSRQLHKRHHLQLLADINGDNHHDSTQEQIQSQEQDNDHYEEHGQMGNGTQNSNTGTNDNSNIPENFNEDYHPASDERHNLLSEQQQEEILNAYEQVLLQLETKEDALNQSLQAQQQMEKQITCLQAAIDGLTIRNQSHQQIQRDLRDKDKLIDELERRCASLKQSERELETRYQHQLEAKRLTLSRSSTQHSPYVQSTHLTQLSANSLSPEQFQSQQQPQQQLQQQYITLSEIDSFSAASVSPNQSSCMTTNGISYRPCRFQAKPPRILNNQALDTLLQSSNREQKKHNILELNEFELFEFENGENNELRGESLTSGEFATETDGTTTRCQRKGDFNSSSGGNRVFHVQNLREDEGIDDGGYGDAQRIISQEQQFTLGKPQKLGSSGFPIKLKQLSLQYTDNEEDCEYQQNNIFKQQMIADAYPALHVISFSQNLNEDMGINADIITSVQEQ